MARRRVAPTHNFSGPSTYVPNNDSAWNQELIDAECDEIRKEAGWVGPDDDETDMEVLRLFWRTDPAKVPGPAQHVFWRYWHGLTRFDLEADPARAYLDDSQTPERWTIRPLSPDDRAEAGALQDSGRPDMASRLAYLRGVVSLVGDVENEATRDLMTMLDVRKKNGSHGGRRVTDDRVIKATGLIAYETSNDIGNAVLRLSQDLTLDEKKASAGPPGSS